MIRMLSLYDIQDILQTAALEEQENQLVEEWVIDTRRVLQPSQAIFVALRGKVRDGHAYVQDAYDRGVRKFLVSETVDYLPSDAIIFDCEDTLVALQKLAAAQRERYSGTVIGITGSYGKTILKEWLVYALADTRYVYRSPKSYNSQIGVALSLLEMDDSATVALIEAGISEADEMQRLHDMIRPDIGVLTSLGVMHEEGFESIEQKLKEKCKLFAGAEMVHLGILHDESLQTLAVSTLQDLGIKKVLSVDPEYTSKHSGNMTAVSTPKLSYQVAFEDQGSVELSLLLYQIISHAPLQVEQPEEVLRELAPVSMRMEYLEGQSGCKIINDAYSLDHNSLKIALAVLDNQSQEWRKTLILSQPAVHSHKNQGIQSLIEVIETYSYYRCILIGEQWAQHDLSSISAEIILLDTTTDLLDKIDTLNFDQEYILIKGARSYQLEKVVQSLQLRKHSVSLEVNLNTLRDNILHYKSLIEPSTKMMVMVKSQSYGTGEYEIAKQLQNWGIDYLGVAYTDEGVALRRKGISLPIMVMNPEIEGIAEALDNGLEIEVYNDRILDAVCDLAYAKRLTQVPIHLKLDTGMHRLGWTRHELPELIPRLESHSFLYIKSTFTHLYAADMGEGREYVKKQIEEYEHMVQQIESRGIATGMHHILNTAGIESYPQYQKDMVRLGIGAYGLSPNKNSKVNAVLTLRGEIAQISDVQKGEHIGYGLHTKLEKDSRIATINVGYADGYMRALGNGHAEVFIKGKKYPTIGNVCMDMLFVDISSNPDIAEGEEVELLGKHIDVRTLAEAADTISYEILTGLAERIPRVYRWE